jgi:hypothetical protein
MGYYVEGWWLWRGMGYYVEGWLLRRGTGYYVEGWRLSRGMVAKERDGLLCTGTGMVAK